MFLMVIVLQNEVTYVKDSLKHKTVDMNPYVVQRIYVALFSITIVAILIIS